MISNNILYKCCLIFVPFFLFSCSKEEIDPRLIERVTEYYNYQKEGKWSSTYEMRTPGFKKTVDKSNYMTQMEKDVVGWELINYEIKEHAKEDDIVNVNMLFKYEITLSDNDKKITRDQLFIEKSKWKKIGNDWYCYDAGYQYHFSFNRSLDG